MIFPRCFDFKLSRDDVNVLLVDRLDKRQFFCKALRVTSRTLEILDDLGILHDAIDRASGRAA